MTGYSCNCIIKDHAYCIAANKHQRLWDIWIRLNGLRGTCKSYYKSLSLESLFTFSITILGCKPGLASKCNFIIDAWANKTSWEAVSSRKALDPPAQPL